MIKAIVSDMDGTLLNETDVISERTKQVLMRYQQAGTTLVLASGRSYMRLMPYAQSLQMKENHGWLIEVNGMAIQQLDVGTRAIIQRLQRTDIDRIFAVLSATGCEIHGNFDDGLVDYIPEALMPIKARERKERNLPEDFPWTGGAWAWNADLRNGYPKQSRARVAEDFPEVLNKMSALHDPAEIEKIYTLLTETFQQEYEIVRTCPRIIEISCRGITKGGALQRIMAERGWQPDEVLVFGDGENDVSMFAASAYSVAMGNAAEYVKSKARFTTLSNRDEGVAAFLEQVENGVFASLG